MPGQTRINVTDEYGGYVGHFFEEAAEEYAENFDWIDGNKHSVNYARKGDHQSLYRTAGGRWVLCAYSDWQGVLPTFSYVGKDAARIWLLHNGKDDIVEKHFGPVTDEEGPGEEKRTVGRPRIEGRAEVRLGDLESAVKAFTAYKGLGPRGQAEALRILVNDGLGVNGFEPEDDASWPFPPSGGDRDDAADV